ncbi:MAG: hypothetical protein IJM83_03160, partial [Firmicutes bacterium]|nr:hypothetical protein [Bacillota bacterium]
RLNNEETRKPESKKQKKEAKLTFYLLSKRSGRDSNPRAVARKLISSLTGDRSFTADRGFSRSLRPPQK